MAILSCPFKNQPRWTRRKEARPQELLSAALDLFVERGYAATRLDDVAKKAGVSKGTLYLYFTNKEELFKAVVRESVVPVLGAAEEAIDSHEGDSASLFRTIIFRWWEQIGSTKLSGLTKLMMAESGNFPDVAKFYHEEVISRNQAIIMRMLERGISAKEFRPIDAQQAINVVVAPLIMLMMWNQSFSFCHIDPIDPEKYLNCYIDLLLRGLMLESGAPIPPQN